MDTLQLLGEIEAKGGIGDQAIVDLIGQNKESFSKPNQIDSIDAAVAEAKELRPLGMETLGYRTLQSAYNAAILTLNAKAKIDSGTARDLNARTFDRLARDSSEQSDSFAAQRRLVEIYTRAKLNLNEMADYVKN